MMRLIINPDGLKSCIEGHIVQGSSRALSEEVAFDRTKVISVDWLSYPILDITRRRKRSHRLITAPITTGRRRRELDPSRSRRDSPRPSSTPPACACGARPLTPERLNRY